MAKETTRRGIAALSHHTPVRSFFLAPRPCMVSLFLPLLLLLGATPVLGSSSPTVLQNLIRGSALKCAADLGGGLRT